MIQVQVEADTMLTLFENLRKIEALAKILQEAAEKYADHRSWTLKQVAWMIQELAGVPLGELEAIEDEVLAAVEGEISATCKGELDSLKAALGPPALSL